MRGDPVSHQRSFPLELMKGFLGTPVATNRTARFYFKEQCVRPGPGLLEGFILYSEQLRITHKLVMTLDPSRAPGMRSISRVGGWQVGWRGHLSKSRFCHKAPWISTGRIRPAADLDSRTLSPSPRSLDRQNRDLGEHFCRGRWLCHLTMPPLLHRGLGDSGRLEAAGPVSGHSSH